jgi:antitoxin ParD1/3/4
MPELIPPEFAEFVENELASGSFHSAEEVVAEGLRLLREHKLYELRKDIDAGLEQIERGEGIRVADAEALNRFFDEIRDRAARRLQEGPARQ